MGKQLIIAIILFFACIFASILFKSYEDYGMFRAFSGVCMGFIITRFVMETKIDELKQQHEQEMRQYKEFYLNWYDKNKDLIGKQMDQ